MARKIATIKRDLPKHWVGDGFFVSSLLSYQQDQNISPFLLLDYAYPTDFAPTNKARGVDFHPHRGFETVTIVYEGELEHKDNAGHAGAIRTGDVQWMTAGRGILHEEKHSAAFTRDGGKMEMVQLWVNLPAKDKMTAPHYQEILNDQIPVIEQEGVNLRVIAGEFANAKGAAKTFTPVHIYDLRMKTGANLSIPVENGFHAMLLVLDGDVSIADQALQTGALVIFEPYGDSISLLAQRDAKLLFLAGEPINEPIAGAGPFVMNNEAEIRQAFADYRAGRF